MKLFGREPAVWVAFLQAVIILASATIFHWSDTQVGALALVVVAIGDTVVAYLTKATLLGVLIGLLKATVAAFATFGYNLDVNTVAALVATLTASLGLFQRTQTAPLEKGNFDLAG